METPDRSDFRALLLALFVIIGGAGVIMAIVQESADGTSASGGSGGSDSPGSDAAARAEVQHPRWYVHTTVNIRSGPGTENEVIDQLQPGQAVFTSYQAPGGWKVVYSGRSSRDTLGWVASRLLRPEPPPDLQVLSVDWEAGEYGNSFATGQVRNNSSRTYSYVQVEINLYGPNGSVVGSTLDNVNNLGPGQVWEFRALVSSDQAEKFRVEDVSGY